MFEKLYLHLKGKGYNAYALGTYNGDYTEPVIVIREFDPVEIVGSPMFNNKVILYLYHPLGSYIEAKRWKKQIEADMEELREFDKLNIGIGYNINDKTGCYYAPLEYNNKSRRIYK